MTTGIILSLLLTPLFALIITKVVLEVQSIRYRLSRLEDLLIEKNNE